MRLIFELSRNDWIMFGVILLMVMAMTSVKQPRIKTLIWLLPIPFTVVTLLLGKPVGSSNLLGVGLLLLFANTVRWAHDRKLAPIVLLIALSATGYVGLSGLLRPLLSHTEVEFWGLTVLLLLLFLWVVVRAKRLNTSPRCDEASGHMKRLILAVVVFMLVVLKHSLQECMTMFPMLGVVAAYEFRESHWYMCRKVGHFALCSIPMMATIHMLQPMFGLPLALVGGWGTFISLMLWLIHWEKQQLARLEPTL